MARYRWMVVLASLTLIVGCSNNDNPEGGNVSPTTPPPVVLTPTPPTDSTSDDSTSAEPPPPPPAEEPEAPAPGPADELQGLWESNCTDAEIFGITENSSLKVEGLQMTRLSRFHSNGSCTATAVEVEQVATFEKKEPITPNGFQVDILIAKISIRPVTDLGVQILKLTKFCDISDWTLNQTRDVTEKTGSERCFPKVPSTLFQIYAVDGNRLFFGKTNADPLTAEQRPTELDTESFFARP